MNMSKVVYLRYKTDKGLTQAEIMLEGGGIASLSFHGKNMKRAQHILDPVAGNYADATSFGSFPLYPAGRIGPGGNGVFSLKGKEYLVKPGRHGILRKTEWTLVDVGDNWLQMICELNPDEYPEGFECTLPMHVRITQNIRLIEAGLDIDFKVENIGQVPAFANLGCHPYFVVKRPYAVYLPAGQQFLLENDVPVKEPQSISATDFWPLNIDGSSKVWDDVFTDLVRSDGLAKTFAVSMLCAEDGQRPSEALPVYMMTFSSENGKGWLCHQIYTPPERLDVVALEPHSTYPNAPYLAEKGVIPMEEAFQEPGEVRTYLVRIGVDV